MQTNIRENISYRKIEKNDYPVIMKYIGEVKRSSWEYKSERTKKRLEKVYFYSYLLNCTFSMAAIYRGQIVGIIIVGNEKSETLPHFFI